MFSTSFGSVTFTRAKYRIFVSLPFSQNLVPFLFIPPTFWLENVFLYLFPLFFIRNYDSSSYIGIDPGREYHFKNATRV